MKMKKKTPLILIGIMIISFTEVLAIDMPVLKSENRSLVREVCIDGLYDNSILYVGANTKILGYIDNDKSRKEVEWQVTGNKGIIDLSSNGGEASIIAKNQGTVWVMARATDGSYAAREYAVNVQNYPSDELSQSLTNTNITPILRRPFDGNSSILRVEIKRDLSLSDKKSAMESYIRKLLKAGNLTNKSEYEDDYYKYFIISINSQNIEVRIEKSDTSYYALSQIILDVSKYNGTNTSTENVEDTNKNTVDGNKTTEKTEEPNETNTSTENVEDTNKDIVDGNKIAEKTEETNGTNSPSENVEDANKDIVHENKIAEKTEGTNRTNTLSGNIVDKNNDKVSKLLGNDIGITSLLKDDAKNLEKILKPNISEKKEILDMDGITIVGGTGVSVEDPLILTVNENMSIKEKLRSLNEYMNMLRRTRSVQFIKKVDSKDYMSYIFKVSSKLETIINHILMASKNSKIISKNDFFIEFRVNKNDNDAFHPIIEMLDNEMYSSNKVASEKSSDSEENLSDVENIGNETKYENYIQMIVIAFVLILGVGILIKRLNRR